MGQTYRFETQVGEGVPEGLCVGCYRCSGKRAGGRWVGVGAALSECGDNASRIMPIPGVGIVLKDFCWSHGHARMLALDRAEGKISQVVNEFSWIPGEMIDWDDK